MNDSSADHATLHDHVNDALTQVQTILGTNPHIGSSKTYSSVAARLADFDTTNSNTASSISSINTSLAGKAASVHHHSPKDVYSITDLTGANGKTLYDDLTGLPKISTAVGTALGTAAAGSTGQTADAGHVHPLPTLTALGAAATGTSVTAGSGLTGGGSIGTSASTISLAVSFGGTGTATSAAHSDHNHDGVYTKYIIQSSTAAMPSASSYPAGTILAIYS